MPEVARFSNEATLKSNDDYEWLTGDEAGRWLSDPALSELSSEAVQKRLRKVLSAERARLLAWQSGLRRKGVEKFGAIAESMFFSDLALEQATDRWIARYKAARFRRDRSVADYCCGIGGDLLALAERGTVTGWDRSPEMVILARANLRTCGLASRGEVRLGAAEEHPPEPELSWHLDPDRRTDGRRSTLIQWHSPNDETIDGWLSQSPNGAIKLAPAAELPVEWQTRAELEWISRGRQCRQLVAWFGELAESSGQRRATVVHNEEHQSFVGSPNQSPELAESVGRYVYDTDPAIRAAKLTGALADAVGCLVLAPGENYLTSETVVEHPLLSCFRVRDVLPLRMATIKKYLTGHGIGELEIKTRGVSTNPEMVRKGVNLTGSDSATLLLTRQGKREIAIVAEREVAG